MSCKMWRGNVAKKSLRFHAIAKMLSDYQRVANLAVAASRHLAWAHGTLAERRSRRLARCRSAALGAQALRVREITPDAPGPLQSGPAHAAWEDRELGLVAVGVGAGVAYADVEHH